MLSSASFDAVSDAAVVKNECTDGNLSTVAALFRTVCIYLGLNVCMTQLPQYRGAGCTRTPSAGGGEAQQYGAAFISCRTFEHSESANRISNKTVGHK